MRIERITPDEYTNLLESFPQSPRPFQNPGYHAAWVRYHRNEYSLELLKIEDGERIFLVPLLLHKKQKGFPEYVVHFDSVSSDKGDSPDNFRIVFEALKQHKPLRIRIDASLECPFPFDEIKNDKTVRIAEKTTYVIDLPESFEEWFSSLQSKSRQKLRKAEKLGVTIHRTGLEGLDSFSMMFYRRFFDNDEMLSTWPEGFFKRLFSELPQDKVFFYEAWMGNEVLSSLLVIISGKQCFAHSSVYKPTDGNTYSNYLLHARVIEDLIEAGVNLYNFGGTGGVDTLGDFKRRLGAVEKKYQRLSWKNRWRSFVKRIKPPKLKKFVVEKHVMVVNTLDDSNQGRSGLPEGFEWRCLQKIEDLEKLIENDYVLKARGPDGVKFFSEKIARKRIQEKQAMFCLFREKMLVCLRCAALADSDPSEDTIPPMELKRDEAYTWHGNTSSFFRSLGYYSMFHWSMVDFMKNEMGLRCTYAAVRADNTPALRAQEKLGSIITGTFYLVKWKKKYWSLGYKKALEKARETGKK